MIPARKSRSRSSEEAEAFGQPVEKETHSPVVAGQGRMNLVQRVGEGQNQIISLMRSCMAYPKRSKDGRRRGPSAEDCRRIWGLPQMSTGDMRNVSIGMDEPVEEIIPSASVPGGRNVTGGGPARGRGHRRPTSRGWAHRSRGVTESILPAVKHMAAPATRSCPKTCRCPIP